MAVPQSPAPRVRPGTVSAAVVVLFTLAVLQVVDIVAGVASIGPNVDEIRRFGDEVDERETIDAIITVLQVIAYAVAAIGVAFAVGFAVLALTTGRGSNPARIVSWVVLGLYLCCGAGNLGLKFSDDTTLAGTDPNVDAEEMQRRIEAATPDWIVPTQIASEALGILFAVVAIILLALPSSNNFFRKRPAV